MPKYDPVIEIRIRNIDLTRTVSFEGVGNIPKDSAEVMDYFNRGIKLAEEGNGPYVYIPRINPITPKVIKDLWVPSFEKNLTLLAEDIGTERVVGSATVFFDVASTDYEQAADRKPGELALTIDPNYSWTAIGTRLVKAIGNELTKTRRIAIAHTDADFKEELAIFARLYNRGKSIENYERYQKGGLSGRVVEFRLP